MRCVGFSTGAVALGDFRLALSVLARFDTTALELSALREAELRPLIDALPSLSDALGKYDFVSVHAPSRFDSVSEGDAVGLLSIAAEEGYPIIVHPDAIRDFDIWRRLGSSLCIENMDKRKPIGRTVEELRPVFDRLPEAVFCFDIAHARQVDPTMCVAMQLLREYGRRIRQVHVSEVDTQSHHRPVTLGVGLAFEKIRMDMPGDVPFIIESVVTEAMIACELRRVREYFAEPAYATPSLTD